ncbi:hypothetical protein, partial [Klebsiella grimontii]|uniref:hypothetical protein n=1 Tax=Klebsiella grimontii TaxID=2058152 RepID=UPI00292B072B
MMNPVPWLQMTNMISYQGLVRTFPKRGYLNKHITHRDIYSLMRCPLLIRLPSKNETASIN